MKKICITIILLVFGINSVVFAQNDDLSNQIMNAKAITEYPSTVSGLDVDTITFGHDRNNQPIEWIVLEKGKEKAFLISRYVLTEHEYNDEDVAITWENCTLRKWLNSTYINTIFSKKEQGSILTTDVINNDNAQYGTKGGNNTKDKLFLLSIDEANTYFSSNSQRETKQPSNDNSWCHWTLRSPGDAPNCSAWIDVNGGIVEKGSENIYNITVRPALWVSINGTNSSNSTNTQNSVRQDNSNANNTQNSVAQNNSNVTNTQNNTASQNNKNIQNDDLSNQIKNAKLVSEYPTDTTVDQIDTVTFGHDENNQPIEWIVLEKENGKALLLSKYILTSHCYNEEKNADWETSSMRKWLNSEYINTIFSKKEQGLILTTDLINYVPVDTRVERSNNTKDKLFLLSEDERKKYNNGVFIDTSNGPPVGVDERAYNAVRILEELGTYKDGQRSQCWQRDPYNMKLVSKEYLDALLYGNGDYNEYIEENGVRPALWVSLNGSNSSNSTNTQNSVTQDNSNRNKTQSSVSQNNNLSGGVISDLPSRESQLRSDNHFYLDNNMQRNSWVYYRTYYYHVDGSGNIQKNQWIELRYVGADGRMYRGRQTPDGKWVGDDGLVVDIGADLSKSLTIEAAEPDSWYKTQSGLWYYFENDRTTTKKGWFTDSRDSQTYYLDPQTGIMAVGWTNIGGSQYYFNESHDNESNWYETGGGFYESYGKKTKAYGSMFKNEMTPDGRFVDEYGKLIQ